LERNPLEIDAFSGPKTPGLIILEHEITDLTITAFINSFPLIATNGWTFSSLAQVVNDGRSYQNALDSSSNDVKVAGVLVAPSSSVITTSSFPTSSASATADHNSSPTPSSNSASMRLLDLQRHSMISLLFPAAMGVIALFS